jgi:hypothetical protein
MFVFPCDLWRMLQFTSPTWLQVLIYIAIALELIFITIRDFSNAHRPPTSASFHRQAVALIFFPQFHCFGTVAGAIINHCFEPLHCHKCKDTRWLNSSIGQQMLQCLHSFIELLVLFRYLHLWFGSGMHSGSVDVSIWQLKRSLTENLNRMIISAATARVLRRRAMIQFFSPQNFTFSHNFTSTLFFSMKMADSGKIVLVTALSISTMYKFD